jgi:hypothetical protein
MEEKQYIVVENGTVKSKKRNGITYRTYYSNSAAPAVRADWEEYGKTVQVLLESGKMLIISNSGVIVKMI